MNNGLAGLLKQPTGGLPASSDGAQAMAKYFAIAKKMADGQLADVLAGKSMDVPQFVAMTEAMGRKQLRNAVEGQQAQQQAQQPTVKDQLMADYQAGRQAHMVQPEVVAGLDQLPADNMKELAGGGIVAFEGGGEVPRFQNMGLVDPSLYTFNANSPILPTYQEDPEQKRIREINEEEERIRAARKKAVADVFGGKGSAAAVRSGKNSVPAETAPDFTEFDKATALFEKERANAPVAPAASSAAPAASNAAPAAQPPAPSGKKEGLTALSESPDFLSPLVDVSKEIRGGIADIKKSKESDFYLAGAKALLGNPNLAKAGSDFAGTAMELGSKSRKEINDLNKLANDYDFNMAKAREARAQGNKELELKYKQLADLNAYHMGSLGIQGQKLGIIKDQYDMVKIPAQLSKVYADAKKEVDSAYNNMVPASKRAQYQREVEEAYRKRAASVGLGKYVDTYSPSMGAYNVVQSPRKGATVYDLDESQPSALGNLQFI